MVPDLGQVMSRRQGVRTALRFLALILGVVFAIIVLIKLTHNLFYGYSLRGVFAEAVQMAPFAVAGGLLLVFERILMAWLVPMPRAGCISCGYPMQGLTVDRCPECGLVQTRGPAGEGQAAAPHHGRARGGIERG